MSESHPRFKPQDAKQNDTDIESSSVSHEELSPGDTSANLNAVQEAEAEIEKLLRDRDQWCNQDSIDGASDHVMAVNLTEGVAQPWHKQSIVTVCMGRRWSDHPVHELPG